MIAKAHVLAAALAVGLWGAVHAADTPMHPGHSQLHPAAPPNDARQLVTFPDALRIHTLANMRDHLQTIGDIQAALATGAFDRASELAEQRLGMSSLDMHGAHVVAQYMPQGMQDAGTAMHRSASRFALAAKDASVSGDLKTPLAELARLSQTCVACHASYRLQ